MHNVKGIFSLEQAPTGHGSSSYALFSALLSALCVRAKKRNILFLFNLFFNLCSIEKKKFGHSTKPLKCAIELINAY